MDPAAEVPSPKNLVGFANSSVEHSHQFHHLTSATKAIMSCLQINPPVRDTSTATLLVAQLSSTTAEGGAPSPPPTPGPRIALPDKFNSYAWGSLCSVICLCANNLPWLERHDSTINWSEHRLMFTSAHRRRHYLQAAGSSETCAPLRPIAATTLKEISQTGEMGDGKGCRFNSRTCGRPSISSVPHISLYISAIDLLPGALPT